MLVFTIEHIMNCVQCVQFCNVFSHAYAYTICEYMIEVRYNREERNRKTDENEAGWIVCVFRPDTLKCMHKLWIETNRNVTVAIENVPSQR